MIKKLAKKLGARRAVNMLTQTALGRTILRKGMSEASKKLNIPVTAEPNNDDKSVWMLQVGKPAAKLHVHCSIHVETLAELAEVACNTWLEDSSVNSDAIMAILQSATNIKEQSKSRTLKPHKHPSSIKFGLLRLSACVSIILAPSGQST